MIYRYNFMRTGQNREQQGLDTDGNDEGNRRNEAVCYSRVYIRGEPAPTKATVSVAATSWEEKAC